MREAAEAVRRWRAQNEEVAVATVVATRGSAPRPVGSKLAVSSDGELAGSVSGGCVEADVARVGAEILAGAPPRLVRYGIDDEQAFTVGLPCGGEIDVYVEPLTPELERFLDSVLERQAAVREVNVGDGHVFRDVAAPPVRVVIVGAVAVAEALCQIGRTLGWRTHVVDPRARFATRERVPSADELTAEWPDDVIELDAGTAVAALAHDERIDVPLLARALTSDAFYVGALGSRRTQAKRRERLLDEGVDESSLARLSGPIGLDIGAETAGEIAVAIAAEIIAARADRQNGMRVERLGHAAV